MAGRPRLAAGHFWTLASYLRNFVRRPEPPPSRAWQLAVEDPEVGEIRLSGRFSERPGGRLVVVIHGIAGCSESAYAVRIAAAANAAGFSCLRLNMRGADRSGEDFFHAGLTSDLHAVLGSFEPARFDSLYVVGFSLGGHVALRAATQEVDPRLVSVAAVCAPLDLGACADAFDRPSCWPYRRRVLAELSSMVEAVASRRPVAVPPERVREARSLREFDGLTVAPRFGFADAEDYYRQMSVGPVLGGLRVPALLVTSFSDPLVPISTMTPYLSAPPPILDVRLQDAGGHVGFPPGMRLLESGAPGLESQLVEWLGTVRDPAGQGGAAEAPAAADG
jgi:predicted alpha/beta-fold hydrolase